MKVYKGAASITIHAPVEKIWALLLNISAWQDWDPNFIRIEGAVDLGASLEIGSRVIPDRVVRVEVTELVSNFRMTWTSSMMAGACKGAHAYILIPTTDGEITFVTYEFFSGPSAAEIAEAIPDMTESFREFASQLKQRAEM